MLTLLCGMQSEAQVFQGILGLQVLYGEARNNLEELLYKDCKGIISAGTAGGLVQGYSRGDLVIGHSVITSDGTVYPCDGGWTTALVGFLNHHGVPFKTGQMFSDPNEITQDGIQRAAIAQKFSAQFDDEESWSAAQVAKKLGIPFIVFRSISDQWDQTLLPDDANAVNPDGSINIWAEIPDFFENPVEAITEAVGLNEALGTLKSALAVVGPTFQFPGDQ